LLDADLTVSLYQEKVVKSYEIHFCRVGRKVPKEVTYSLFWIEVSGMSTRICLLGTKEKMNTNASRAFSLRMEKDSRFRLTKWQYKPPCTGYMRCSLRDVASIGMMFLEGTNNFK